DVNWAVIVNNTSEWDRSGARMIAPCGVRRGLRAYRLKCTAATRTSQMNMPNSHAIPGIHTRPSNPTRGMGKSHSTTNARTSPTSRLARVGCPHNKVHMTANQMAIGHRVHHAQRFLTIAHLHLG